MSKSASYVGLYESGRLQQMEHSLYDIISECTLCPHHCGVDRTQKKTGKCRSADLPVVSSYSPHFGEERCLVGRKGSGTIFFTHCNLDCIFCQNYDISHLGRGAEVPFRKFADMMLELQRRGCHNINFVSPTHMLYQIIKALLIAVPEGLAVPLVYNSGGYDSVESLQMVNGVFDIYMPDFKYMNHKTAFALSHVQDYPLVAQQAVTEMYRQVGDLVIEGGIARRGLLVRHLVLSNNCASTDLVLQFLAGLSPATYVNIMDQYRPEYMAGQYFDTKRRVTIDEYDQAVTWAIDAGLTRLDGRC